MHCAGNFSIFIERYDYLRKKSLLPPQKDTIASAYELFENRKSLARAGFFCAAQICRIFKTI